MVDGRWLVGENQSINPCGRKNSSGHMRIGVPIYIYKFINLGNLPRHSRYLRFPAEDGSRDLNMISTSCN